MKIVVTFHGWVFDENAEKGVSRTFNVSAKITDMTPNSFMTKVGKKAKVIKSKVTETEFVLMDGLIIAAFVSREDLMQNPQFIKEDLVRFIFEE